MSLQSVKKSPFQVTLQEKWLFGGRWLRYRIRTHNKPTEVEQLLGLFPYITTKVPSDLCFDKTRFLVIYHRK